MVPSQLVKEGIPTIRQTGQVAGVERVTRMGGAALLVPEFLAVRESGGRIPLGPGIELQQQYQ